MGLLDSIGGTVSGLLGLDDDSGFNSSRAALARNRALYDAIKLPEYKEFNPELYKDLESYQYALTNEDPSLKSAQMDLLNDLAGLKDTGLSAVDEAGFMRARNEGNQLAKSGAQAAMQNAEARGVGGSGLEFAMREMASQGGAQRAQEAGLNQAAESARQRALYAQAYGQQLGNVRGQDQAHNQANTDIINRFNQMNTQQRNQTSMANTDQRNNAFQYNQGLLDKRYNNEIGKADRIAGMNNRSAEIDSAQSAQRRANNMAGLNLAIQGAGAAYGAFSGPKPQQADMTYAVAPSGSRLGYT